jgi:CRP-like cAMP-binding protein
MAHERTTSPTAEYEHPDAYRIPAPGGGYTADAHDSLESLIGDGAGAFQFESLSIEARENAPAAWWTRYSFAVVRRGYLIRARVAPDGKRTSIDAVGPGCCFPIDRNPAAQARTAGAAYAVTRSLLSMCDEETFTRALGAGGTMVLQLNRLEREAFARMERLADARGRASAASKVGALLCTLADTLRPGQEDRRIPAEFLQRDLAGLLSIRHESVCRVMRDFTKRGLIERVDRAIVLKDPTQLECS